MKFQNIWAVMVGVLFLIGGLIELRNDFFSLQPVYGWIHIFTAIILFTSIIFDFARRANAQFGVAYCILGFLGLFGFI